MAGNITRRVDPLVDLSNKVQSQLWVDRVAKVLNEYLDYNLIGTGVPTVDAPNGATFRRTDGGAGSTFYVREGGTWVAK